MPRENEHDHKWGVPLRGLVAVLLAVAGTVFTAGGQVTFGGLDLTDGNRLLFHARTSVPRFGAYDTAFLADLDGEAFSQLSFFPERLSVLASTGQIQIQNRFGVFRTPRRRSDQQSDTASLLSAGPQPLPYLSAFVHGDDVQSGKTLRVAASPDGRYMSVLRPTSAAFADLVLYDTFAGQESVVSRQVEIDIDRNPSLWSPDGTFFVYTKSGRLFYFSLDQQRNGRVLAEELRGLGAGSLNSVRWADRNTLYYVSGTLVYRVLGAEFFARSLYQDLPSVGAIVGKLPYNFDPSFDRFWISPAGDKVILDKDGRNLITFVLQPEDFTSVGRTISLPYLYLPRNTRVERLVWAPDDTVTIFTTGVRTGDDASTLYRLDLSDLERYDGVAATDNQGVLGIAATSDGARVLLWYRDRVEVRDHADWSVQATIESDEVLHAAWSDTNELVIATKRSVERVDIATRRPKRTLIALSRIDGYRFAAGSGTPIVRVADQWYRAEKRSWREITAPPDGYEPGVATEQFRVYLERLASGSYETMIMVRNVASFGTRALFSPPKIAYEAFPETDDPVDLTVFSRGSRIRGREVALVFNAVDSIAGLTEILATLSEYDVRATFFINGDVIRQHPGAIREIADSGHEVGSLFYTHFNMASAKFAITRDFVQEGLARNEDEYFDLTGRELSLLWHAPFYFVSPELLEASQAMNYTYIGRDVDSLDWVAQYDATGISRLYRRSADIIETVVEQKRPGSIIAMTVGRTGNDQLRTGRDDYLFERLDVLMNALLVRGYRMVTVSTLIDRAR